MNEQVSFDNEQDQPKETSDAVPHDLTWMESLYLLQKTPAWQRKVAQMKAKAQQRVDGCKKPQGKIANMRKRKTTLTPNKTKLVRQRPTEANFNSKT